MQRKHLEKKKLRKEIISVSIQLKSCLTILVYTVLLQIINMAVRSRKKTISLRHQKKLLNLRKCQYNYNNTANIQKIIIHNFSTYTLIKHEGEALIYGLDQHISPSTNKNTIKIEFEYFYQNILNDISDIPSSKLNSIKAKLRSCCEKYYNTRTPYKYKTIMKQLSMNGEVIIMKQDKGRGVVIMNRSKYLGKCLLILQGKQFMKLNYDRTSKLESKIQRTLRKIKSKLQENIYKKLYPKGSAPGKFYRNAKIHKLSSNDINDLPLRPIVSNIGTAT